MPYKMGQTVKLENDSWIVTSIAPNVVVVLTRASVTGEPKNLMTSE